MTVILIIRLIFMILDLYEIAVDGPGIQTQTHQRIDRRRLGNYFERPALFVLELDQVFVVLDDFVALVDGGGEEFGQREPLPGHFVAVVGVDELVVVDAVGRVA